MAAHVPVSAEEKTQARKIKKINNLNKMKNWVCYLIMFVTLSLPA